MKNILIIISTLFAFTVGRPEPPAPQKFEKFLPSHITNEEFASDKGVDAPYPPPKPAYGPPKPIYGPPAEKLITKNVYIHVPPEEPIEYLPSQNIQIAPTRKHYKIIFIKAPEPQKLTAPIIPPQPQDEHKTLVYVLVKKPEPPQEIQISAPQPTEPSKPEVYFIKYKNVQKPAPAYGPPKPVYGPPAKHH